MGATVCETWKTKAHVLAACRSSHRYGRDCTILKSRVVGFHHWMLVRSNRTGVVDINVDFLSGPQPEAPYWGYSSQCETQGLYAWDCPVSFLNACPPPDEVAKAWREKVVEWHEAEKKRRASIKPDTQVTLAGVDYKLIASLGRQGWKVERCTDRAPFRMSWPQLNTAKILA